MIDLIRKNLVDLIYQSRLTKIKFAEKLGISRGHLDNLLKGVNRFNEDTIENICDTFKIPYDALFRENGINTIEKSEEMQKITRILHIPVAREMLIVKVHELETLFKLDQVQRRKTDKLRIEK